MITHEFKRSDRGLVSLWLHDEAMQIGSGIRTVEYHVGDKFVRITVPKLGYTQRLKRSEFERLVNATANAKGSKDMFKVTWNVNGTDKESDHASKEAAQKKARTVSQQFATKAAVVAEDGGEQIFENGKVLKTAGERLVKAANEAASTAKENAPVAKSKAANILEEFGVREGSNRAALLDVMSRNLNKQVPVTDLIKAVYGNQKMENQGPLMMVMKGIKVTIESAKLKYVIEKTREDKLNHFGLHVK